GFRATSALEQALKISPACGIYFMKLQFGHTHSDTATAPAFNVRFTPIADIRSLVNLMMCKCFVGHSLIGS
ncbi:MAG: hypothetical protein WA665_18780, partial [Pseudolabrys sp.]